MSPTDFDLKHVKPKQGVKVRKGVTDHDLRSAGSFFLKLIQLYISTSYFDVLSFCQGLEEDLNYPILMKRS